MNNDALPKWRTTNSKYLVHDRWLKVRADTCVTPDGDTIDPWYVLEYPDWIGCVAIDSDDNVTLLRHYRHGADAYVTEIIGGTVDAEDASPEAAAIKELREEIGYEGGELYQTGVTYPNPSYQPNKMYNFLAVGGACTADKVKEVGADFVIEKLPFTDFVALFTNPKASAIYQSMHIATVFSALNYIRYTDNPTDAILRLRSLLD